MGAINLIGLNLLLGIMIDTFAQIRGENDKKRIASANYCFICNIERRTFEISPKTTFKRHQEEYHNVAAYTDFLVHTQEKNVDDLTGIEAHVRKCIRNKRVDWFPLDHAEDLQGQDMDSESNNLPLKNMVPEPSDLAGRRGGAR